MRLTLSTPFAVALSAITLSMPASAMDDATALAMMESLYDGQMTIEQAGTHGRVAESDIWYGTVCESTNSGTLFLIKASSSGEPLVFRHDGHCSRGVSWRDIDGDGTPEIRATSTAGGTGVLQVSANFYRWDDGAAEPTHLVRFLESSIESWDGAYRYYGFETPRGEPFTIYRDGFLPVGALCPSEDECELVTGKRFCVGECDSPVPADYLAAPGWEAFVVALGDEGFEPGNAVAGSQAPEVTQERQAAFDAWLSE